jgi:hypothetical protein
LEGKKRKVKVKMHKYSRKECGRSKRWRIAGGGVIICFSD